VPAGRKAIPTSTAIAALPLPAAGCGSQAMLARSRTRRRLSTTLSRRLACLRT
jgi:hypothetical protein